MTRHCVSQKNFYDVQYITATRDTSLEFDFTSCFISKFFINLFHEMCELFFKRRDAAVSENRIPVPKIRFLCLLIFFCFSIISIIAFCQSLEAGGYMKQPVACSAEYPAFSDICYPASNIRYLVKGKGLYFTLNTPPPVPAPVRGWEIWEKG